MPQINLKLKIVKTEQDYSIVYMDSTIISHVYETLLSVNLWRDCVYHYYSNNSLHYNIADDFYLLSPFIDFKFIIKVIV